MFRFSAMLGYTHLFWCLYWKNVPSNRVAANLHGVLRLRLLGFVPCTVYIGMHVLPLEPRQSFIVECNNCLEGCAFAPSSQVNTNSQTAIHVKIWAKPPT
jgi:hypothetical protein